MLSLGMRLLIGIYMTHRKIRARCCLGEWPFIRHQPSPTTGGSISQEPFDLIRLTIHLSVVRSIYLWAPLLSHEKQKSLHSIHPNQLAKRSTDTKLPSSFPYMSPKWTPIMKSKHFPSTRRLQQSWGIHFYIDLQSHHQVVAVPSPDTIL